MTLDGGKSGACLDDCVFSVAGSVWACAFFELNLNGDLVPDSLDVGETGLPADLALSRKCKWSLIDLGSGKLSGCGEIDFRPIFATTV